jgi:hypothetical protein
MTRKNSLLQSVTAHLLILLLSAVGATATAQTAQPTRVQIQPNDITVLMGDRAKLSGGPEYKELDPGKPFKRFWVESGDAPDAAIEWNIAAPNAGEFEVTLLIEGASGDEIEITSDNNALVGELPHDGWDKVTVRGRLSVPKGDSAITVRFRNAADIKLKSVELINLDDKDNIESRIEEFRADPQWLADAHYGLMFQWREWGYPRHGDKKQ